MSFALIGASRFGGRNPYDLVWVDRLADHVYVFGFLAALLFGAGIAMLTKYSNLGLAATIPCMVVALGWSAVGFSDSYRPEDVAVVSAPPGPGRDYEVVVRFVYDEVIDPAWRIWIRQEDGLMAHEWEACYIRENPFDHVEWESRRHLKVVTATGSVVINVNPRDGYPRSVNDPDGNVCAN